MLPRKLPQIFLLCLVLLLVPSLVGCSPEAEREARKLADQAGELLSGTTQEQARQPEPEPSAGRETPANPGAVLESITIAQEGSMAGYDRELFPHWSTDPVSYGWEPNQSPDDSCDVRDAALVRDGEGVQVDSECQISAGSWVDPFTGASYTDSQDLDIDHLVPIAEAFRSGASEWSTADREAYANAPGVLVTADDAENQEKGDQGPEAWRPPNQAYWCTYASRWAEIKAVWGLSVDPAEKAALSEMLTYCS